MPVKNDIQNNGTFNASPVNIICLMALLSSVLLSLPLQILLPQNIVPFRSFIQIFSIEAISALSIVVLLLKRQSLTSFSRMYTLPATAIAVAFAVEIIHFMGTKGSSERDFLASLILFILPLAFLVLSNELSKSVKIIMSILWTINIIHCS